MNRPNAKPASSKGIITTAVTWPLEATEEKGDLLIRNLWKNVTDSIHNMRVVNTDAKFHLEETPKKCLQEADRMKKKMYLEAWLHQRQHFSPFVFSIDGLLGVRWRLPQKG